ncbi:MAG: winged helix-turn-helix transcriptional regulator [Euryarchaeota archaeon]|nr:winged helix-turn-helix transcriptional regulator [Euryarchaeota archaeon]
MKCDITDKCETGDDRIKKLMKILSQIPEANELHRKSEIFKALSDPTRLKILYLLQNGELCVCEIIIALEKPQSTISHHLNILKNAGIIKWRKEGVWIHYSLSNPKIVESAEDLIQKV